MSIEIKAAALAEALLCPVSLEPLTEAVALTPCLHKINETAANQLFGGPVKKGARFCPVCNVAVKGWKSDLVVRDIVSRATELLLAVASLPKAAAAHFEEETVKLEVCAAAPPPAAASIPQRVPSDEGPQLIEEVVSGDLLRLPCGWGMFAFANSSLCWGRQSLEFEKIEGDSPILGFTFFNDVSVSMRLEFLCEENGKCAAALFTYLQSLNLVAPLPCPDSNVYETSSTADVRKLLTMFKKFNDVPPGYWDQMDALVAKAERRDAASVSLAPTAT